MGRRERYIGLFNRKPANELLERESLHSFQEAGVAIESWYIDYDMIRFHSRPICRLLTRATFAPEKTASASPRQLFFDQLQTNRWYKIWEEWR